MITAAQCCQLGDTEVELSVGNIEETCETFRRLLGDELFLSLMGSFSPETAKGLRAYNLAVAKAHPFAVAWTQLQKDVAKTVEQKTFALSDPSIFLLDFFADLKAIADAPMFQTLLANLKPPKQFFSTVFEAHVFSAYRQLGANIEIVPVSDKPRERRPDFVITPPHGQPIYVECKSLEDFTREEDRIWNEIKARLATQMFKHRRSWRITLTAQRNVTGADVPYIIKAALSQLSAGLLGQNEVGDGAFVIKYEKLGDTENYRPFPLDLPKRGEHGWVEFEGRVDDDGKTHYRHPVMVEVFPHFDADHTKRVLALIDTAYRQISPTNQSVLHIEIPYRDGQRFLDVADVIFHQTFQYLGKKRPRMSAVVLNSRTIDRNMKEGGNPILNYQAIIPNPASTNPLPTNFAISGSNDMGLDMASGEGTVLVEFEIYELLPKLLGKDLYYHCSADGWHQLRLWQSYSNQFRADIVHPDFGRRTFKGDLNYLEIDKLHKLAAAWSLEDVRMAVNGTMIDPVS